MVNIAICEDLEPDSEKIKNIIRQVEDKLNLELRYECYPTGEELLNAVGAGEKYDLAVLDIYMGGLTGIETAKKLRERIPDIQLAFLTSSTDFAIEAIDLNAVHYLIKPVTAAKLTAMFERFYERIHMPLKTMELFSGEKHYVFPLISVQKIQSSKKGVDIYLKNNETVHIREPLINVEKQLDSGFFLKITRGLIVQMSFILCMNSNICCFRDGTKALLSRRDCAEIRRKYNDYLFQTRGV